MNAICPHLWVPLAASIMLLAGCGLFDDGSGRAASGSAFSVSGTITASAAAAADSDVNDPFAPYAANDGCDTAPVLPNPVTLGGYLNIAGRGPAGRSFNTGDVQDVYRVPLTANQTITLYFGKDATANDLDLYLVDASCTTIVESSEGITPAETITVPAAGEYFVVIFAPCDAVYCPPTASNYILAVGQGGLSSAAEGLSTGDEFVPGEVIVRFRSEGGAAAQASIQSLGLIHRAGAPGRPFLFRLGEESELAATVQALGSKKRFTGEGPLGLKRPPGLQKKQETIAAVRALRERTDVASADLNYIRRAFQIPDDTHYPLQWHYPQINLPAAWDIDSNKGEDVIVAVIDTGVLLGHPDLQGQLIAGYDFISDPDRALDGNGIDPNPDDPGDRISPGGSSFHGTHVSGTIAARSNNASGVAGIAWNARIMPLRALGKGGGTSHDILQAVLFAAGLPNDSGAVPPRRADIINLSLGGGGPSATEQAVYTQAREQGVIVVAAAGNGGSSTPNYPASYNGVISVSAVDIDKNATSYSSFGPFVDVAAPGGDVSRDANGDGYADGVLSTMGFDDKGPVAYGFLFSNGTSMATPHVTGVLALMKSVNPALAPDDLDDLLAAGAITEDLGAAGRDDRFGWGLIDAFRGVQAAGGSVSPNPLLQASPLSLNFSTNLTNAGLRVRNAGSGSLQVSALTDDADWLTVTADGIDANGLGAYRVTVDRAGRAVGIYSAVITVTSNADDIEIPVIMQVAPADVGGGDAGFHWMVLVDPDTLETVRTVSAPNIDGRHSYVFTDVPPGRYLVIGGTDANNDFIICGEGEACGAYPTLSEPAIVVVEEGMSGLDFVSTFNFNLEFKAAGVSASRQGFSRISSQLHKGVAH